MSKIKTYIAISNLANGGNLIKKGEIFAESEVEPHLIERYLELGSIEPYKEELAPAQAEETGPKELDEHTLKELVTMAQDLGVEVPAGTKKADLIALVREAQAKAKSEAEAPKTEKAKAETQREAETQGEGETQAKAEAPKTEAPKGKAKGSKAKGK